MSRFWSICKNTFVQTIRQPIYGILILATFAVLVMALAIVGWTLGGKYRDSDQKMLENLGLSTLLVSGLLVAAFSASSVLSREIEDKTALTVISKPVSRGTFVLGKFVGVLGAVTVGFYLCALVFLLTVRHGVVPAKIDPYDWPVIILGLTTLGLAIAVAMSGNYFFGWTFTSAAVWVSLLLFTITVGTLSFVGKEWAIVPLGYETLEDVAIHGPLLLSIVLIFMGVIVFVAVAITASTRLGQATTLLVCCTVLVIGAMHPYLFGHWVRSGKGLVAARVAGAVMPKLTYFFPIDALMKEDPHIPVSIVGLAGAYCAAYVGGLLALGMALFERRQLEAQSSAATLPGAVAMMAWVGRAGAIGVGIVGLVLVTLPQFHTVGGFELIAALLGGALLGWILWAHFAKGASWAYWVTTVIAICGLGVLTFAAVFPGRAGIQQTEPARVFTVAGAALAVLIVIILVVPRTRRHFK